MRERTGWRGHKERDKAKKKYSRQENQISTRELVSILTYWLSLVKKAPSADFKVTFTILIVYGGAVPFPSLRNYPLVFFILGNQFKPFTFFNLAGNIAYFLLERYMEQTHAYTHMHTQKKTLYASSAKMTLMSYSDLMLKCTYKYSSTEKYRWPVKICVFRFVSGGVLWLTVH